MQRSRTQVLFSYLPGSVFVHETGYIARSTEIRGSDPPQLSSQQVLLEEIDRYMAQWDDDRIQGMRRPSRVASSDFRVLTPEGVRWEFWPLRFECARENCRRIVSFQQIDDIQRTPRCATCNGRLRQLRYLSAHECGRIRPMYIPHAQPTDTTTSTLTTPEPSAPPCSAVGHATGASSAERCKAHAHATYPHKTASDQRCTPTQCATPGSTLRTTCR